MEKPKVGVFVCRCGSAIGDTLDIPALMQYASTLPYVTFVQDDVRTCTPAGLQKLTLTIVEQGLNRVAIAACTPRTHAPIFQDACRQAGLNPYLLEFVNIREQCSLAHADDVNRAMKKAKDLLRMGVASAINLQPLNPLSLPIEPAALVIGAGVAGMTAALGLANRGFRVKLVEKEATMGGLLRDAGHLYPTNQKAQVFVEEKMTAIQCHQNIDVFTLAEVRWVEGAVGHYDIRVGQGDQEHQFTVGVIIIATGAQELIPDDGLYGYDGKQVITQSQLEQLIRDDAWMRGLARRSIVMVQCVGARDETRPYCSRICCMVATKNAIVLKEADPETQVFILYRDMMSLGTKYEKLYSKAREQGVAFIQYDAESPPDVRPGRVVVEDKLLGEELSIDTDLIVLSTPLISQQDTGFLAELLKVPVDEYGFFQEAHLKHRPLDMAVPGIFHCGSARWPSDVGESVLQAYGAVSRASILLGRGQIDISPTVASVNVARCSACGLCEETCSYHAVAVVVVDERRGTKAAQVREVLCQGCGACVAGCRSHAIDLAGFSNQRVFAAIKAF